MASKRMAISALLSSDAEPSRSSPAPHPGRAPPHPPPPSDDPEPPHKRQRHAQAYSQQYYESYNAYPYATSTPRTTAPASSAPPATAYYSPPPRPSPPQWSPSHEHRHPQWEDPRRYVPAPTAFDFARQQREAAAVPDARHDERDELPERRRPATGESLVSVLTGQMRARQMGSASGAGSAGLPAPPQLRREAQQQQPSSPYAAQPAHPYPAQPTTPYTAEPVNPYPVQPARSYPMPPTTSPPVRPRDLSPLVVRSATPHTTPPGPSPASTSAHPPSLSPTHAHPPSPRPQRKPSHSPTTAQRPRQDAPQYSRPSVSPSTPYPPHPVAYTSPGNSPTTPYPPRPVAHFSPRSAPSPARYRPVSPCMQPLPKAHSHASPGTPPTAACIPPPRPPSSPTSARGVEMPSPAPPPPPARPRTPPPQPQTQPQTPPQPLLLPAQPTPVLQLQPPKTKIRDVEPDDERSFEDELLSLVDGDDVKPKIAHPAPTTPVPQAAPPRKSFPSGRKAPGSATKATPKPRAPKASKAKAAAAAVRHVSGTSTPVPGSSMPPPSPTPQPAKQMPAVARAKGKLAGTGGGRKKGSTATRSRSLSVKPPEPTPAPVEVEMVQQDDRLYCLCKTPYEEEKIMIACDRCDEWYHPACVGMVEAEVDLVDQFICSSCGAQNSQLNTTYKPRCHRGLNYVVEHDKLPTCYKPARGDFSKYCSDECGVAHMAAKVAQSGYTHAQIYPAVKNARRREGVTIAHGKAKAGADGMDVDAENDEDVDPRAAIFMAMRAADEREIAELQRRLDDVTRVREESELTREIIQKRRRLLDLAEARAMGQFCGWDSRLLKGDKEWAAWVDSEVGRDVLEGGNGDGTDLCGGPAVCPRHKGWQTLRSLEVQLEVDLKSASIENLMKTEQELQHRIDAIEPTAIPPSLQRKCEGGKKQGKQSTR